MPEELNTATETAPTNVPAEPVTETSEADPRADINKFAADLGYSPEDFSAFESIDAAKAGVRSSIDQIVKAGRAAPAAEPAQQPQPAAQPAAPPSVDPADYGLDPSDPNAKAIAAVLQQNAATQSVVQKLAAQLEQNQTAAREQSRQQLASQAGQIVDNFKSPYFGGANGRRTAFQDMNVQRLYNIADDILVGAVQNGRPAPSLQQRLGLARFYFEQEMSQFQTAAAPAPAETQSQSFLPQRAPSAAGAAPQATGLTTKWSSVPGIIS